MSQIALLTLALAASPIQPATTPDPASLLVSATEKNRALKLVQQLGSERFPERNRAFLDLREMGRLALDAIRNAASADTDPEVRHRCELLLSDAQIDDFNSRLAVFLADRQGKYEHQLAGWDKFQTLTKGDPLARELFAQILQDEENRELVAGMAHDIKEQARRVMERRTRLYTKMYNRTIVNGAVVTSYAPSLTDAAALLFCEAVIGEKHTPTAVGRGMIAPYTLLYRANVRNEITSDRFGPMVKTLMLAWIDSRETANGLSQAMSIAQQFTLPELKSIAAKLLLIKQGTTPYTRANAAATIARVGTKDDVKLIVPLLNDDTILRAAAGTNGEIQVRDAALAMAVVLSGRELKEFGFETRVIGSPLPATLSYYGQWFPTDTERKKAFEKWVKLEPTHAPPKKEEPKETPKPKDAK